MFSDFKPHHIGGPQLAPLFGIGAGNVISDGPGENYNFGCEQLEGYPAFRYNFRPALLRNLKVAPAFFHNGAFTTLEAVIAHHLDVEGSLRNYDLVVNHVPSDLFPDPFEGILAVGFNPQLRTPIRLTKKDFRAPVEFLRDGLFDKRVLQLCSRIAKSVPSGLPPQFFEGCD